MRSRQIVGQSGYKSVCINEGSKLSYGTYFNGSANVAIIGFPNDNKMFALTTKKSTCNKTSGCLYIPEKDILITKQYLINSLVRSLVVYKNFSKRITKTLGTPTVPTSYNFDLSNPDYIFQNTSNYAWPVESVAASENGKWLVVEFKEKGIGVLNLETFEMRKIANTFLHYGGGLNPTAEMAISNEGTVVAIVGMNSGLNVYENNGICGALADDSRMTGNLRSSEECKKPFIYTDQFIDRFYAGYHPRLNDNGAELRFYASSYNRNNKEVALRAAGYNPIQLEYLAIGDSFTSGEGETNDSHYFAGTNDEFEKCHVSDRSYPLLLGSLYGMNPDLVKNIACSGAKMEDVVGKIDYWGQGGRLGATGLRLNETEKLIYQTKSRDDFISGRVAQYQFADKYSPKAITISIGGNDAGLMGKLKTCMMPGTCEWAATATGKKRTAVEIVSLFDKLVDTYQSVIEASPTSKVYVVGYPKVIKKDGFCSLLVGTMLNATEREYMDESIKLINETVRSAAKRVGIQYLDIEDIMGEGRVCGNHIPPVINDVRLGDDFGLNNFKFIGQETFHPRPEGHQLIAQSIHSSVYNMNSRYCYDSLTACADATVTAPSVSIYWSSEGDINSDLKQESGEFIRDTEGSYRQKNVETEDYIFEPGSQVTVEIHSEPINIGTYTVSELGSVGFALDIPSLIEDGYHTVHIYGKSYSGELIDVYEVIDLFETPVVGSDDTPSLDEDQPTIDEEKPADDDTDIPSIVEEVLQDEASSDLTPELTPVTNGSPNITVDESDIAQPAVLSATDQKQTDVIKPQEVLSGQSSIAEEVGEKGQISFSWYIMVAFGVGLVSYLLTQLFRVIISHRK